VAEQIPEVAVVVAVTPQVLLVILQQLADQVL
jgi:hypothetical protein